MVQIVNSPSLAALTGQSLGTGIGNALQQVAAHKLQQMQNQRSAQGLQALLGLSPEIAQQAIHAPEKVQQEYAKRKLLEPSQQAYLQLLQQQMGGDMGAGGAQQLSPDLQKAGITEQQATKLTEFGLKKQEQKATEQRHYEKLHQKRIESIESEGKAADRAYNITKRMADVIKSNKAQLGDIVAGKFVPQQWLNESTQELISLGNDLVLKKAQLGKGVPTKFRLAMEEMAKPGIWMKPQVALSRIKDIQDELLDDIAEQKALEVVQEQHGITKNFKPQLSIEKKKQLEGLKKQTESKQNVFAELPEASKFEGKTARNPATGQKMKSVNGKWEPVKE